MTRRAMLIALLCLLIPQGGEASTPAVWEHPARPAAGAAPPYEKDGRRADGLSVSETGTLALSAPMREIFPGTSKLTAPQILWTASLDQSGNLFVGAGNTGEAFRIDRKGTATSFLDTDEMGIRAMACSVTGEVYVATFPGGGVYRVGTSGKSEPWFDTEDRYIWAMALNHANDLFIATGERGIVYQVLGQDDGRIVYDSDEAHITALGFDPTGRLLAGTAPGGLLYRVMGEGKSEPLLDSGLDEISSVAVTPEGVIYAAAISEEVTPPTRRPGEKSDLTIEVTPAPDGSILEEEAAQPRKITIDLADLMAAPAVSREGAVARIYRLEPGRPPALAWKSDSERVFSLAWHRDRGLIFGTGGQGTDGRIYRLEQDGSATMLRQFREPQVTVLLASPDGRMYAGTGNPGRVYLLDLGSNESGSYLSSVHDAGHLAQFGTISWDADVPAGTRVEITTRSGNRPTPDESWSAWSPPYASEKGSSVASPPARYLQWKTEMSRLKTDAMPALRRVRVTLLPENRPPLVRGLRVQEDGAPATRPAPPAGSAPPEKPQPEKMDPPKGSRWVTWTTSDPDDDQLAHSIYLRRAGEPAFRLLADQVGAPPWALDDTSLAEGRYVLKVSASDAPTNGTQRSLAGQDISDPFTVDHTPPKLQLKPGAAAGGRTVAEVMATDGEGVIGRGEYTVEGDSSGPKPLPCRDGICDTANESFLLDLPDSASGHKVTVRVYDAAGNSSTAEIAGESRKGGG